MNKLPFFFIALFCIQCVVGMEEGEAHPLEFELEVMKPGLTEGTHSLNMRSIGPHHGVPFPPPANEDEPNPLLHSISQAHYQPHANFRVEGNKLTGLFMTFPMPSEHTPSFIAPPFIISIRAKGNRDHILKPTRFAPRVNEQEIVIPFPEEGKEHESGFLVEDLPAILVLHLITEPMDVTSYTYVAESGIPDELLTSEEMYDLAPINASMMFKFMAKVEQGGKLGVWITRRPPIPDATFILGLGEKVLMAENLAHIPPGGMGLSDAVPDVHSVMMDPNGRKLDLPLRLVVHFYERKREKKAFAIIDKEEAHRLAVQLKSTEHPSKFADRKTAFVQSTEPNLKFQLEYYSDTKYIAIKVLQPHPIQHLQLTVYDKSGNIFFREEEDHIPYFDHDHPIQFGWYHVLGTVSDKEDPEEEDMVTDAHLLKMGKIEVRYSPRDQVHPLVMMKRWIEDYGGEVDGVQLNDNASQAFFNLHSPTAEGSLHERGLVTTKPFLKSAVLASLPYRLLLTKDVVQVDEWCQYVYQNVSDRYDRMADEKQYHNEGIHFMLFTLFAITQPNHPHDGTNWRLYFDTFPRGHPPLPIFYNDAELSLFDFSPQVKLERNRQIELYNSEYNLLLSAIPWIKKHASAEEYFALRSHIESRVLNVSGTLLLLPLMDYCNHDDDPTARVTYNDVEQKIFFEATRDVPMVGDAVTLDYGTTVLTKREFLSHFGFVPPGAIDVLDIEVDGKTYHLTTDVTSRDGVIEAIQRMVVKEKSKGSNDDDEDMHDVSKDEAKARLSQILNTRASIHPLSIKELKAYETMRGMRGKSDGAGVGKGVSHLIKHQENALMRLAARLLASEKRVLDAQLRLLSE